MNGDYFGSPVNCSQYFRGTIFRSEAKFKTGDLRDEFLKFFDFKIVEFGSAS